MIKIYSRVLGSAKPQLSVLKKRVNKSSYSKRYILEKNKSLVVSGLVQDGNPLDKQRSE